MTYPIIDAAEHAWVLHDPRFRIDPGISSCPGSVPDHEQSGEDLIAGMKMHGVDRVVISHVCYYGRDNSYVSYCVKTWPERFAGIGLLVGHRLHAPGDPANPDRLEAACAEGGLAGLRLSPIYDRSVVWLNDPVCDPLWHKAAQIGAVFNIFLAPHQIGQVADMAARHPGVNVVVDHFAMIDISRPDEEGFAPLLDLHRLTNVFIRTSLHNPSRQGLPFRDMWPYLERVYDLFGPTRLLYANLYELLIMKEMIPFFSDRDREWVMGRTAAGLYFGQGKAPLPREPVRKKKP
jgi:predicted TIM-barrel fold metal-dependent hydrolase